MASQQFLERFAVPPAAYGIIDDMVPPFEQAILAQLPAEKGMRPDGRWFYPGEACGWLGAAARPISAGKVASMLHRWYGRGLLDQRGVCGGEQFALSDFFTFLDVFCVAEPAKWAALPAGARAALDKEYLARYVRQLRGAGFPPTQDEVLPLAEIEERILADERPLYLTYCDCRALHGGAAKQQLKKRPCGGACLSYRTAPGSFTSRGLSRAITKREAVQAVRAADAAGLIHTICPGGICSCGPSWCYLFRAQAKMGTGKTWPKAHYTAELKPDTCIGCGACVARCPFGCFTPASVANAVLANFSCCTGCGLCINTPCPAGAIHLVPIKESE